MLKLKASLASAEVSAGVVAKADQQANNRLSILGELNLFMQAGEAGHQQGILAGRRQLEATFMDGWTWVLILNRLGCRLAKLDIFRLLISQIDRLHMNYCRLFGLDIWVSIVSSNIRLD